MHDGASHRGQMHDTLQPRPVKGGVAAQRMQIRRIKHEGFIRIKQDQIGRGPALLAALREAQKIGGFGGQSGQQLHQ